MSSQKRNTIQKQLVFDTVKKICNHPTAEEVYCEITKVYADISVATVYRNLNNLVIENKLRRVQSAKGADRFDHVIVHHYHAQCKKCNKLIDVKLGYLNNIDDEVEKMTGFTLDEHEITFSGLCSDCVGSLQKV